MQVTGLAALPMTDSASSPISSSIGVIPFAAQASSSSCSIGRDASLMSVSPLQNSSNPSLVPGPSTAKLTPGFCVRNFSPTSDVMGSTVDEPEMLSEPDTSSEVSPVAPPPSSSSPPHAAATNDSVESAATIASHFLRFPMLLLAARTAGHPAGR